MQIVSQLTDLFLMNGRSQVTSHEFLQNLLNELILMTQFIIGQMMANNFLSVSFMINIYFIKYILTNRLQE